MGESEIPDQVKRAVDLAKDLEAAHLLGSEVFCEHDGGWEGPGKAFCVLCGFCGRCQGTGFSVVDGLWCRHCAGRGSKPGAAPSPKAPAWVKKQLAEAKAADDERSGVHPVSQGSAMDIAGEDAERPGGWHPQLLEAFGQYPKTDVRHLRQTVLDEVAFERARQIAVEGYDSAHDDHHEGGQLARAGGAYALAAGGYYDARNQWPWDDASFKPKPTTWNWRRRCLIKAMALLCAEVERLDRAEEKN